MWFRTKALATTALLAAGTVAVTLVTLWPRTTFAEEIPDEERHGEWEEEGMRFGNVVVSGKLVADATTPGGWTLVRTLENKADTPESCVVEERILRNETIPDARVGPREAAVLLRNQPIALGPHQKRSIGIPLPEKLGAEITAGLRAKASIERDRARLMAAERYDEIKYDRTYTVFRVEYLKQLPPGATAAKPADNDFTRPESYASAGMR
jgi:hypothetical protein